MKVGSLRNNITSKAEMQDGSPGRHEEAAATYRKSELGGAVKWGACPETLADDMLYGAAEIAVFLWGDAKFRRRVFYLASLKGRRRMPVFRVGGARICATKSRLISWIRSQEESE